MGSLAQSRCVFGGLLLFFVFFSARVSALETPQQIGFFCSPDGVSVIDGQYYLPQSGTCTYHSPTITGLRYGDIYRGTVASSTIINGHYMSDQAASTQFGDTIPNPQSGEDIFVAIYPALQLSQFRSYFQTGGEAPVGTNYGFVRFKYGSSTPPAPAPAPILTLSAIFDTIEEGNISKLDWSATNVTVCMASGGWSGSQPFSGLENVAPTTTTTYTLTCSGEGGEIVKSVTITVTPRSPDPVIIIPGVLGSEQHNGEWVIDPILHTYDDLIATLDVNHYTPGVDLFTFPYNWRKSNVETAVLLKEKINEVRDICHCEKVDLVAHSMGGLVARQYIQSESYDYDVDQLIFLGTPHLGAPKAYLMWEGGETDPAGLANFVLQRILDQEAKEKGYTNLFTYLNNEPIESVKELLPIYDYIFEGSSLRQYPLNYPTNLFLETLNNEVSSLNNSGVEIHNFVGSRSDSDTITGLTVIDSTEFSPLWHHGYPSGFYEESGNYGLERGSGDATVPLPSASFIQTNLHTSSFEHNQLPDELKARIFEVLAGRAVNILVDNNTSTNYKLLLIKILSPADLLVIAPDGKKIGKNFATGQEINEIPNAFYTGFTTDTEYITILNPLDGDYKILNQGTGSGGAYTIETNFISNATTTEDSYTGNTVPGLVTELTLEVDTENPAEIEIKSPDSAPPVITMISPQAKDYLRSEQLPINISAFDSESGVKSLGTQFDTVMIANVGSVDLFYTTLGSHTVVASSTDVAGNATTSSRTFRVIANATSTLSDFERAYSLGWITKKVHDELLKKIKAIVVVKKTIKTIVQTIIETGKNGKKTTKNVSQKVEILEQALDKAAAKAILKELDKYRGKGLNEQAYQLLKEDLQWLIKN